MPAPYLLVGHSLGGFYARHYAHRFPGEVAGLVLLDPAHEDYDAYMPEELVEIWHAWDPDQALPDDLPDELIQFYRGLFGAEMTDWPEEIREPLIECHVSLEWLRVGFQEAKNLGQLNDELRRTGKMPDVPLIILTAMGIDPFKQAVSGGTPRHCSARRSKASGGSTRRWPNRSRKARTASSMALGTSPSTSAVPTPLPRRSRICSPGSVDDCIGRGLLIGVTSRGTCRRP